MMQRCTLYALLGASLFSLWPIGRALGQSAPSLSVPTAESSAGSKRFSTTAQATTNYYTNPGRKNAQDPTGIDPDASLLVLAGLRFESPSNKAALGLKLDAGWEQYLGALGIQIGESEASLSGERANLEAALTLNRAKAFSTRLHVSADRSTDPASASVGSTLPRIVGEGGAELRYAPGGGAFVNGLSYAYAVDRFDAGTPQASLNKNDHRVQLRSKWLFLPKTSLLLRLHYVQSDFLDNTTQLLQDADGDLSTTDDQTPVEGTTPNRDGFVAGGHVGISGRLSTKLEASAKLGYTYSGFRVGNQVPIPSGDVGFQYFASELMKITGGFEHSIRSTAFYGDISTMKVKFGYKQQFGRVQADLGGSAAQLSFQSGRSDQLIAGKASVTYHLRDHLALTLRDETSILNSDAQNPIGNGQSIGAGFQFHQISLGATGTF